MAAKKPILVFVPGAWFTPEYLEPVTAILQRAGYVCDSVTLPCVNAEQTNPAQIPQSFDPDVAAVRRAVTKHLDAGHDVVLVAHSYGGVVGSEAVRGLDRGARGSGSSAVVHLVYVAALVLDVGTLVWPTGRPPVPDDPYILQGDLVFRAPEPEAVSHYSPAQVEMLSGSLHSHAWKAFTSPITHAAWRVIPGTFLRAKGDPFVGFDPPEGHKFGEVVEIEGDHFPFVTATEETAEAIRKAVESSTGS
ncbi:alpha/beta-hydrolase [Xylariaceae sp. FL0662B]|nr:alpha/beta-hydrolase [Xylariaceae sp. FL0662B]